MAIDENVEAGKPCSAESADSKAGDKVSKTLLSFLSTMQENLSSSTDMLRKLLQSKRRSKSRDSDASCDTEVNPPKRLKPNSDSQEFGLSETTSKKVKERVSEKAVNERA